MNSTAMYLRKYRYAIFLNVGLMFCCAFNCYSTTWYISPVGNDITGDGTIDNPWLTLYKATETVNAIGDTIHVKAGIYLETEQCLLAVGVSIEGDGVTSVIQSLLTDYAVAIIRAASPEGTIGNQHISNLKFDGRDLATSWAIQIQGRSNFSIYNCTVQNFFNRGIIWGGRDDNDNGAPTIYATGNSFHDNIVSNSATCNGVYGTGCLGIGGQDGMLVYNNTITSNSRAANTNGWPIKYWNEGHLKGVKIYNNTLTSQPLVSGTNGEEGFWDFSIELFYEQGLEIYGNTCTGSIDVNYNTKGAYPYAVYIHDNTIGFPTFQASRQSGIILEFDVETAIIENNTIRNCVDGIIFSTRSLTQLTNIDIRKNLIHNVGSSGGNYGQGIGTFTDSSANYIVSNMNIYNNTIVAHSDTGYAPFWGIAFSDNGSITNLKVKNNTIQGFKSAGITSNRLGNITNSEFQYNDLYLNGNDNDPFPSWASTTTLPSSTTVSNNLKLNPVFMPGAIYTLQPASPLINTGIYVGLPYTGVAPDMGYDEANIVLPVKLAEFTVAEKNSKNLLQWKTETEVNSDLFTIERSSDGQNYTAIGTVQAAGFSSVIANYAFTDATPLDGINYYRLLMIDKDNSFERSNIVSITNKKAQGMIIVSAQLSAGKRQAVATVSSSQNQKANLVVFDQNGRVFLNQPILLQKGINSIDKNTTVIARGIYYVKVVTAEETLVKKLFTID